MVSLLCFHNAARCQVTDLRVYTLMTLGVVIWRLIVWRRNKGTPHTLTSTRFPLSLSTIVHLPQKPDPTHLVDTEKSQDCFNQIHSPKPSLPPAYSPGPMENSTASSRKSAPALKLDVNCDRETTQTSPLRSASVNPITRTQSFSSRLSSRMSMGAKKLYVHVFG